MADIGDADDGVHLVLPRSMFGFLSAGFLLAGGAGGFALAPNIERSALERCFDNAERAVEQSSIALQVAGDQSGELQDIRLSLQQIRDGMYTIERAREDQARWERDLNSIERRLRALEK